MGYLAVNIRAGGDDSGGGSADLDAVTAAAADVLSGKVIVDAEGNPVTGTMPDKTGTALTVATNGKTLIPKGYHDGTKYATNTQATMAGKTITPSSSAQTVACSGKLMTGNIVVSAIPSKYVDVSSGVTVFHNGTLNTAILPEGFKNASTAEAISYSSSGVPYNTSKKSYSIPITGNTIDFTPFSKLTVVMTVVSGGDTKEAYCAIYDASSKKAGLGKVLASGYSWYYDPGGKPTLTVSVDVSSVNQHGFIRAFGEGSDEEENDDGDTSTVNYDGSGYITSIKLS